MRGYVRGSSKLRLKRPVAKAQWLNRPGDISRRLWLCLLVSLVVDGVGTIGLAFLNVILATTLLRMAGSVVLLAIGVANLWAFNSTLRGRQAWARDSVIAQLLVLVLALSFLLLDVRSLLKNGSWTAIAVIAIAISIAVIAVGWVIFLWEWMVSVPDRAAESDSVIAARTSRLTTIVTALITAIVGITGTISAAFVSYNNNIKQLTNEKDKLASQITHEDSKSRIEFLRQEREKVYADFSEQLGATENSLINLTALFVPTGPRPTKGTYDKAFADWQTNFAKLATTEVRLRLVASEPVRDVSAEEIATLGKFTQRAVVAGKYVDGGLPDDDYYKSIPVTRDEACELDSTLYKFETAARADVGAEEGVHSSICVNGRMVISPARFGK
ncbi:hypothetical protein [Mycobacterium sp.]|uniref:hypothetical protein n=1 Tax=Mycobacterium sp. TaxID=1785 RepID=UPI002D3D80CD|nr:hypothetical protein [Mycobacterium sp.]HZA08735.1 hypothetical protein [Mycobacterium sp.]